ncbi:hypothetical protein BDY17DRAFT_79189 [Neohortaea acidophila]|uniref:Uncharacterized protein n=1 Tax=Neohortaea acidophila TaxID=245834 RepID=A0A6A6Q4W2_9PEZI|nr:uncharacterized protein BDY17DRAFT_79189 [Neohortaea acidophila]KAF2486447.1 hypothetical protein BDY17DRAFT_79189 [Neohortaea acidophila]
MLLGILTYAPPIAVGQSLARSGARLGGRCRDGSVEWTSGLRLDLLHGRCDQRHIRRCCTWMRLIAEHRGPLRHDQRLKLRVRHALVLNAWLK